MPMTRSRAIAAVMVGIVAICACHGDAPNIVRGKRLTLAVLPADAQARIYEAAARGSFGVDGTSLLLDPRVLPRAVGLAEEGRVPQDVVGEMRRHGAIKGTCEPPLTSTVGTAQCA